MSRSYGYMEIVGSSKESFDHAVDNAIQSARGSGKHLDWFEVIEQRGYLGDEGVLYYQAHLKVGYRIEEEHA